ncbi:MAG TPA: hypothetical protein VKW76_02655 [Candidatus Binatia bacterium]|nr:hypothetical protein [Candidatus Binatia bacterium]
MDDRRAPAPKAPAAEPDAPTTADSWERHTRIADLVRRIRRTRALRLSPEPRPQGR